MTSLYIHQVNRDDDIMANARELALQTLTDILIDGAYSNHALSERIEKNELTVQDKNFMTELVYGTLQHEQLLIM